MKRISSGNVTETLMKAMEQADEIEDVIVIYQCKKEFCPDGKDRAMGCYTTDDSTLERLLFMCETFKLWIIKLSGDSD